MIFDVFLTFFQDAGNLYIKTLSLKVIKLFNLLNYQNCY